MTNIRTSAPWHKESFDNFLNDKLPELLAARLPLAGYRTTRSGPHSCNVTLAVSSPSGEVEIEYTEVPTPSDEGIFEIEGVRYVVLPTASQEELDLADIRCVGEQLYDYFEERLGQAPPRLPWDESLLRAWLPLADWVRLFLRESPTSTKHDERNWLSRCAHVRKILIADREKFFAPGQLGRTCPFESPEGINIGRILTVAVGAQIRDGKLVVVDDSPEAALGVTASLVPFIEHNSPSRQAMALTMMRQWLVPPDPEPALVQTGNEPDAPDFWCGRNLLTAFISWGPGAYEDGLVVSESCAKRLSYPFPLEPGDKLSNRHGAKGVVGAILPDDEMPRMTDGTPVELIFSFVGCHWRLNFGQIREAVMSRIARAEGAPIIVPPFQAPPESELRRRLAEATLAQSGMETLTNGRDGLRLSRASTVGWVYWGRTFHNVRDKIKSATCGPVLSRSGELEYYALRDIGAFETIRETFSTRSEARKDAEEMPARLAAGKIRQAGPPTPLFSDLTRCLAAAGIHATLKNQSLTFNLTPPEPPTLKLAAPVPHPWLRGRKISEVGAIDSFPEYQALVEINTKAQRMLGSGVPESLSAGVLKQLEDAARDFFDALVAPDHLRFAGRSLFSGRSILAPALDLRIGQTGLPDEIAWTLFAPLVARDLGDPREVENRTKRAAQTLDEIMARSWVLLNRAPTIMPTSFLAFHPVRIPERVIRIHPLACKLMNADFDGDAAAVFLPITEEGQAEAGERLSVAAHLRRDPELIRWLVPTHDILWGLAELSLTAEGRKEISRITGTEVATPDGFITRQTLEDSLHLIVQREGVEKFLDLLHRLMPRSFEAAKQSGASLSPFPRAHIELPTDPQTDHPEAWDAYSDEIADALGSRTDFNDPALGPQLLAVKTDARGDLPKLVSLVSSPGSVTDPRGERIPIRHGLCQGLSPDELYACAALARESGGRTALECAQLGYSLREAGVPRGFNVLARAMRAKRPGVVFARAAAAGETDPLTDIDARLFVGLSPLKLAAK